MLKYASNHNKNKNTKLTYQDYQMESNNQKRKPIYASN
jgi:hypothetical protein